MCIFIVMSIYASILIIQMINKKGANATISYNIVDLSTTTEQHQPGLSGLEFAFAFSNRSEHITFDSSVMRVELIQGKYTRNGTLNLESEYLEISNCDNTKFNLTKLGFTDYNESHLFCPKYNNFTISASFAANTYEFVQIKLLEWNGDSNVTWQSDDLIDQILEGGRLNIILLNSYIDFEDYDSVVKTYLDSYSYKISKELQKEAFFYVRK